MLAPELSVHHNTSGANGRNILTCVLAVQAALVLSTAAALLLLPLVPFTPSAAQIIAGSLVVILIHAAALYIMRLVKARRRERIRAKGAVELIDTVLCTSREWLWAVDDLGYFTFSSSASQTLLGYHASELIGKPCSMVIEADDLVRARETVQSSQETDTSLWTGVIVRCRHRDGSTVWMESSGKTRPAAAGQRGGSHGTSRLLAGRTAEEAAADHSRARIREVIDGQLLFTAFQPIHDLGSGNVIGVEALSRFVSDNGAPAEYWFNEATAVGLGPQLEFAAMEAALSAAHDLPAGVYLALNLSPATCLDRRLQGTLALSPVPLDRIVLELTERLEVEDYGVLTAELAPLRRRGLRIAVDDAGSGFASMRHILHLRPDIIKLDRSLIAGINEDIGQHALGAAMVEFARQTRATLVAEGIETAAELAAVTGLGMTAGQGYFLGRPTIQPEEWAKWPVDLGNRNANS
ncbi:EAL domain-containing protein [Arthrobacter sp. NPDC058288]|uniref:sensor domain-containing phosphodiesterase n=1 Tax=Arthrobacter sp. NPDC058288 TaxID=3346424 RepID=UPI0036EA0D8D